MSLTPFQLRAIRRARGSRVKAARLLLKLTQVDLADELKMTQSSLSDLERHRYANVTVDRARKFAEYFGCQIEDLFPSADEAVAS